MMTSAVETTSERKAEVSLPPLRLRRSGGECMYTSSQLDEHALPQSDSSDFF